MAKKPLPTPEELRQLLRYDPDTGRLFWKERGPEWFTPSWNVTAEGQAKCWNARWAGTEALTLEKNGYLYGPVLGVKMYAQRVAFAIHNGRWPVGQVDHDDRDRKNNRPLNLLDSTPLENMKNMGMSKRNSSGVTGVVWSKAMGKWRATIREDYSFLHLGYFDKIEDAAETRRAAQARLGYSDTHGLPTARSSKASPERGRVPVRHTSHASNGAPSSRSLAVPGSRP